MFLASQRKFCTTVFAKETLKCFYLGCSRSFSVGTCFNQVSNDIPLQEKPLDRKFIPMTRRTLIRKLMEHSHLISENERDTFLNFTVGLETKLSQNFHGVLAELKQLYDPLNPDKETMTAVHVGNKERAENEYWLLLNLSQQLEKANFQELPRKHVINMLKEHPVYEGVVVSVDIKNYDVLRFWVLSEDEKPIEYSNWFERMRNNIFVLFKKWPKTVPTYKRVVLAVRTKKQNKLILKAYKDVPKHGLEYFLPEGKIQMSKFDQGFIATTVSIGVLSILIKVISSVADYHIKWMYILGGVTGLLTLKCWNAYKNKYNKYLVNLSKSLYFKTIANNRALLTLIVDRAEDEVYKSALLAYTLIRAENKNQVTDASQETLQSQVTINDLKASVESWMKNRYNVEIDYNPQDALKQLEEFGLLKAKRRGDEVYLSVLPLDKAIQVAPVPEVISSLSEREEDLDIEDILPENVLEILDTEEKGKQEEAERFSAGWQ